MPISDKDMLAMAARLAIAGHAKVKILATSETATIVLPGKVGKKITLRLNKSGKTIERLPKEIALLPSPPPPAAPLTLGQICALCLEEAASKKCSGCGAGVCSQECYLKYWKEHKPACLEEQSGRAGEEYAREENRAVQLLDAAQGPGKPRFSSGFRLLDKKKPMFFWGLRL